MTITKTTPAKKTTERKPAEKVASSKAAAKTAASRQILIEDSAAEPGKASISAELRVQMIRDAAYFRAESRGFTEGDPIRDWMEAEADIDQKLLGE